jgi:small subunit ribosomal protein S9
MTEEPTPTPEVVSDAPTEAAAPAEPARAAGVKSVPKGKYIWGTGRRKTAVARVRIRPGDGKFEVNKRDVDKYFLLDKDRHVVRTPLVVTDAEKSMDVFVNVCGGGISGQSGAVVLGLARALAEYNPDFAPSLKEHNLLTRDPRKVERKKYGQRGARRRFQFSKR